MDYLLVEDVKSLAEGPTYMVCNGVFIYLNGCAAVTFQLLLVGRQLKQAIFQFV